MSNPNAPFGFRHLGINRGGPATNFSKNWVKVAYNYGTALYKGDVLVDLGTGYGGRYTSGVAGSNVLGIIEGFEYLSTAQGKRVFSTYLPVGDTAYDVECQIIPIVGVHPQLFAVQATSGVFSPADIGENIEPAVSAAGSIVGGYGKSAMTITQGTNESTTGTLPFRIVDFYSNIVPAGTPGTDDTSSYHIMVVASNPFNATGV